MIVTTPDHLLFFEPTGAPTAPIVDHYTRRVTAAWRARVDGRDRFRGQHFCTGRGCTATSGNGTHKAGGLETNSLCIHYVACHRSEVPAEELAKILALPTSEVDPTPGEMAGDWRACAP
jgi:hypothetical protein